MGRHEKTDDCGDSEPPPETGQTGGRPAWKDWGTDIEREAATSLMSDGKGAEPS